MRSAVGAAMPIPGCCQLSSVASTDVQQPLVNPTLRPVFSFVARDVRGGPISEFLELASAIGCHAQSMHTVEFRARREVALNRLAAASLTQKTVQGVRSVNRPNHPGLNILGFRLWRPGSRRRGGGGRRWPRTLDYRDEFSYDGLRCFWGEDICRDKCRNTNLLNRRPASRMFATGHPQLNTSTLANPSTEHATYGLRGNSGAEIANGIADGL